MTDDIAQLKQQLESVEMEAESLVNALNSVQFVWRPNPGSWCVAECINHLTVSLRALMPALREAVARGHRDNLRAAPPYRYPTLTSILIKMVAPPVKMRTKAPKALAPVNVGAQAAELAAFRALHDELIALIVTADGLDLRHIKVPSPVAAWFKLPLGQSFQLVAVHCRRHLWQARNVTHAAGFPD